MNRPFTDDDREKRVITSDGRDVGSVQDVDDDRATVERSDDDESLTDEVGDLLGWSDGDEQHELRQDQVHRYTDDELHLKPRQ